MKCILKMMHSKTALQTQATGSIEFNRVCFTSSRPTTWLCLLLVFKIRKKSSREKQLIVSTAAWQQLHIQSKLIATVHAHTPRCISLNNPRECRKTVIREGSHVAASVETTVVCTDWNRHSDPWSQVSSILEPASVSVISAGNLLIC